MPGDYLKAWEKYCCNTYPVPELLFVTFDSPVDLTEDGFEAYMSPDEGFYYEPSTTE